MLSNTMASNKESRTKRTSETPSSPELESLAATKDAFDRAMEKAAADRFAYERAVVTALEKHGYPTLARISNASIGAMRNIVAKHDADNPRSRS